MIEKGEQFPVLDHGYVKLIDWMGGDEDIVEAARMSTGKGFISWDPYPGRPEDGDTGFLEFLLKNNHTSPFEMCELVIETQAPIMVYREWHRHRTQSYNEFSARYAQMPDLHYLPERSRIQAQNKKNKQGSAEPVSLEEADAMLLVLKGQQDEVYGTYDKWVEDGIAKEIARLNTPVSRYSKCRMKTDLLNWLKFLNLRMRPNAQWEIRQYANLVASIIEDLFPRTYRLFEEYMLHAVSFSRTEMIVLGKFFQFHPDNVALIRELALAEGLSQKKVTAFIAKLTE